MSRSAIQSSSQEECAQIRQLVAQASEPIAPFWPMRTMVAQNPIHGLEYLPFDQAVRRGKRLLGGNGYLSNEEYRQLFREGRITADSVNQAFQRVMKVPGASTMVNLGNRQVTALEVWKVHLLNGIEPLEPALLPWELSRDKQFRPDLPDESRSRIIEQTVRECEQCREYPEKAYLTNLWKSTLAFLGLVEDSSDPATMRLFPPEPRQTIKIPEITLPSQYTMSDWVDALAGTTLVEQINQQMVKWVAAFLDEGIAGWEMPRRSEGFYQAWRQLVRQDYSVKLLGVHDLPRKIRELPDEPEIAIRQCLHRLGVPTEQWKDYLSRELSLLPGWTRYIRWLGENMAYHQQTQYPIDTTQYLAVRLFYEVEMAQIECRRHWGIEGAVSALVGHWRGRPEEYGERLGVNASSVDPRAQALCREAWRLFHLAQCLEVSPSEWHDLSVTDANTLLSWLDDFPAERHGPVWLEAYEETYRRNLIQKLSTHRGMIPETEARPRAQLVFCIDVRSESFRRHIEAQGPYETLGFAGFFGIPISHQAFDSHERAALCPVLLSPNHAVTETPRVGEEQALQAYASGTRWQRLGDHLFHDLKQNPIGSMMVIDLFGFFFSLGLVGKTLVKKPFHAMIAAITGWYSPGVPTQISLSAPTDPESPNEREVPAEGIPFGLARGFSLTERATCIENGLRGMGLTGNFGRLVCLCGHGSETDNNPYYGALDCGACGGNPGDANARVFAAMANDPEVRRILKEKGLLIPEDTWFLPGKHNTTTDRVTFYDLEDLPPTHTEDVRALRQDLADAGANQALERCHRIPHAPTTISPEAAFGHVEERGCDWANPRPEWGLAGNAAFLIGRRQLTKGLDLGGRVFLHSYDPIADPQGVILEKIMTAPLIVGEWINMGYYFSAVDPWAYGSGSKVLHNVVGGVGVMLGSQSDLQMGFPVQTVNNGDTHYHEPMRLLAIIEATPEVLSSLIEKHAILQQLFHNQWLNLLAFHPHTGVFHRYNPDAMWEATLV